MDQNAFITLRAIGPLQCRGEDKTFEVMEIVVSDRRVLFRKHFFDRDTGRPADRKFALRGRLKLIDNMNSVSFDTTREWKNFVDFLARERGVEVPGFADQAFYEPVSATWDRTIAQAA